MGFHGYPRNFHHISHGVGAPLHAHRLVRGEQSGPLAGRCFGAFAGFWISYSALVLGLTHNWYGAAVAADAQHVIAQFLIAWAVLVLMLVLVSLRIPLAFTGILTSALIAVILLIIGDLSTSGASLDKIAGVFVLLFSAIGFYSFLSLGLDSVGGKALPLGSPIIK